MATAVGQPGRREERRASPLMVDVGELQRKRFLLLDALYGELDTFTSWLEKDRSAFLVSAYLGSTLDENAALSHRLAARGIPYSSSLEKYVGKGSITIIPGVRQAANNT